MRTMMMMTVPPSMPLLQHHHQQQQPWIRLLLLLVLLMMPCLCWSMPTYILEIPSQKCIEVEGPVDSTIRIAYFIPDLNLDTEDDRYTGPVQFTLNTVPSNRVIDTKQHPAPVLSRLKPIKQSLITKTGQIEHKFEVDGTANICMATTTEKHNNNNNHDHNNNKNQAHSLRFAIHVERKELADLLLQLENNNMTVITKNVNSKKLDKHLSKMEMELQRIQLSMKTVLKEADFAKERDALAHQQVISVHSASMFWPIVQVCVLIMTGFTQASHIVHFFKTRRII